MTDATLALRSAPIVEAVVDIECDFQPGQDLAAQEPLAKQIFAKDYPKFRAQFQQKLHFEVAVGEPLKSSARSGLEALQFLKEDERQLVQVRASGYSFNRLAPYTTFDDYLPEIRRAWDMYRQIASPILVKALRLRYINRILLPLTNNVAEMEEYFRLGPRPAEESRLRFMSFLTQYAAVDMDTGHQVTTVLTTERSQENGIPVIFDNGAAASLAAAPEDWDHLAQVLNALRALKNRVFINTLTPKCLSLFQ